MSMIQSPLLELKWQKIQNKKNLNTDYVVFFFPFITGPLQTFYIIKAKSVSRNTL